MVECAICDLTRFLVGVQIYITINTLSSESLENNSLEVGQGFLNFKLA